MKRTFAIPMEAGKSCAHFGHCEAFAILEVEEGRSPASRCWPRRSTSPGYPKFLADAGVNIVISGGMGVMAQNLFRENNIEVHMGVGVEDPAVLVAAVSPQ